jgi:hypothetical protein
MKRKEHVPNWAIESFVALISNTTSSLSPFQIAPLDDEKRDQYEARGSVQGITWMLSVLEPLVSILPLSPRPKSISDRDTVGALERGNSGGIPKSMFRVDCVSFYSFLRLEIETFVSS